jgi:hypothetical protein
VLSQEVSRQQAHGLHFQYKHRSPRCPSLRSTNSGSLVRVHGWESSGIYSLYRASRRSEVGSVGGIPYEVRLTPMTQKSKTTGVGGSLVGVLLTWMGVLIGRTGIYSLES